MLLYSFVIICSFLLSSFCFMQIGDPAYRKQGSKGSFKGYCILIIAITFQGIGLYSAFDLFRDIERNKAIEANAAHYVVDSKTGKVFFEYLKPKEVEEK